MKRTRTNAIRHKHGGVVVRENELTVLVGSEIVVRFRVLFVVDVHLKRKQDDRDGRIGHDGRKVLVRHQDVIFRVL